MDVGCVPVGCVGFVKPPRLTVCCVCSPNPPVVEGCAVVCPSGFVVKLKPAVAGCVEGGTPGLVRPDWLGRLNPPTAGCVGTENFKLKIQF